MPGDFARGAERGQHIDEAEKLCLEMRVAHRPVEGATRPSVGVEHGEPVFFLPHQRKNFHPLRLDAALKGRWRFVAAHRKEASRRTPAISRCNAEGRTSQVQGLMSKVRRLVRQPAPRKTM